MDCLTNNFLGLVWVSLKPIAELIGHHALHKSLGFGVAQLGLGLAFKLRLGELDRDNSGESFADVVTG